MGGLITRIAMKRKVSTADFFARHPVFSLDQAEEAMAPPGGRPAMVQRLKHHLSSGRLLHVARGLYAVVPAGFEASEFRPDPFLVAAAARPDAVFCHHSALELLGAAHSVWNECTAYTARPRRPISLADGTVSFLAEPQVMQSSAAGHVATRKVERRGQLLVTTGPERTLVEGFRWPDRSGGLEELVVSAGGFVTLNLELLEDVLERYAQARLWAATGWFLEQNQETFHVPEEFLARMADRVPRSPQYLERGARGGAMVSRWNLIVPEALQRLGGPDDR